MTLLRKWGIFLISLALCGIVAFVGVGFDIFGDGISETLMRISGSLILIPVVAIWQLICAIIIFRSKSLNTKLLVLAFSCALAIDYLRFVSSVDLTGSSTSGVALVLYPLMRQTIWAAPFGLVLLISTRWLERRRSD